MQFAEKEERSICYKITYIGLIPRGKDAQAVGAMHELKNVRL